MEYIGQQLGSYRLNRLLGRGGMADVYLGEHVFLNTRAAIKILRSSLTERDLPAFLKEARLIGNLNHPNIVRVLDFGVQQETPFLVMEYAPNGTLRQHYPLGTHIHPLALISLIKHIASALQYAHDRNVIHCDVKPENMLLGENNTTLLSDFGISLIAQSMSVQQVQEVAGTIAYMAPEQLQGKPQRASDQYAFAVIIYEWLSGERLFRGSLAEVSGQHLYALPTPLSTKIPEIAPEIDEVLRVALAKDPAQRFFSVQAFANALEQACQMSSSGQIYTISMGTKTPSALISQAALPTALGTPPSASLYTEPALPPYPDEMQTPPIPQALPRFDETKRTASRRSLLLGVSIGAGALVVGSVVGLTLSGTLSSLFGSHTPAATRTQRTSTKGQPSSTTAQPALGTTLLVYSGQSDQETAVDWQPHGRGNTLASSSEDGSVAIWNAANGNTLLRHQQGKAMNAVAWSPDGKYLASAGDDALVQVWDANTNTLLATYAGHHSSIFDVDWSPDGQRIVSASQDQTVQVWNAFTGAPLVTFTGHSNTVWSATWSPDGRSIASGSFDGTAQIWDPNSATLIRRYSAGAAVRAVAWSPDGQNIASGNDNSLVQVWLANSGNVLTTYRGHTNHVESVEWSHDGTRIASASKDGTVQIWNSANAQAIYTYRGHTDLVWSLAWSPDGQLIASASADKTVHIWQAI